MAKEHTTSIIFFILLSLLSGSSEVWAQDPPPAQTVVNANNPALGPGSPPSSTPPPPLSPVSSLPPNTSPNSQPPLSPTEIAQFQNWLQSNGKSPPPAPLGAKVLTRPKKRIAKPLIIVEGSSDSPVISPPLSYRQSQQIMLQSAPPSAPPTPDASIAFNAMMKKNMPLTPEQVVKLRQLIDVSQRAASIAPTVPPKPVSTTLMVNLAPGSTPPAIRIAQGYVTSLVFVDSTGTPWPIASYDIGDPKAVTLQWDMKSNIMLIQAVSPYTDGNLVVRLVGLPTPLTVELVSGQRVVDFRVDLHVPGIGPNTKDLPTGVNLPSSASQLLLNVLDGVAPGGGKPLTVTGGDCQAWLVGDKMYLRTRLTVLSPGWVGKMVSPDGMNAYEMQRTSSVLVSQYGEPIELKIEGF